MDTATEDDGVLEITEAEMVKAADIRAKIKALSACLNHLPEEYRNTAVKHLYSLSKEFGEYQDLAAEECNVAIHDARAFERQRDCLWTIILKMCHKIGDEEITCMEQFPSEIVHMVKEGMLYNEKRTYVPKPQPETEEAS